MSAPAVTNPPSMCHNGLLSAVWLVSGVLTVLFPLTYRSMKMNNYQSLFEMYNWEAVQRQYHEKREYFEQMYANMRENNQNIDYNQNYMEQYYGEGEYDNEWEEVAGTYDINQCKWYQINCFPYYINENGQPEPADGWYPSWFSGWTVSEEEREAMLEAGETSSALKFAYAWQIIMFSVILIYGFRVITQNRVVTGLNVALLLFANMCFLGLWMLADGSIVTEGEYVQNAGFYGQFSVLMFMTNAWYAAFGVIFATVFAIRSYFMHMAVADPKEQEQDATAQNYKALEGDSPPSSPNRKPTLV